MKRRIAIAITIACSFIAGCSFNSIQNLGQSTISAITTPDELAPDALVSKEAELVAEIIANGASVELQNPSFEAGWSGWNEVYEGQDETAISDIGRSGAKSAKITGAGGQFQQTVAVLPNSNYELRAHVRGNGTVGVLTEKETLAIDLSLIHI